MTLCLEYGNQHPDARMLMRVRRALELTQTQMAVALNVKTGYVSMMENGHRPVTKVIAIKLRNLAFYGQLSFAVDVFPQYDDPAYHDCPSCRALRERHIKQGLLKPLREEPKPQRRRKIATDSS